ncbi:MAG: 3-oxoacyl-ACP reductase [Deltaproteobacteria bacterium]|jgi:3-oxoacyl-[acyl-carrier protein] reductase|nr:3-oxoacyl-ACP reductase [Deltaproteobacteria bacterium]|tara:strand:- start:5213 stop:5953 length:741 start_codon:yes stop_codon:yes gene_type:complete
MSNSEKIALITGASRGIGKAIALTLGRLGIRIAGTSTTEDGANSISKYLNQIGIEGRGYVLDVAEDESVASCVSKVVEEFGHPLIVVNNAGITRDNLLLRMKSAEWADVINTNLSSLYRINKIAIKGMTKARWGRIINISSVVGASGNAGQTNYSASKAGAEGFARSLAQEIGSRGITVNSVAPGFIQTDMTGMLSEAQVKDLLNKIPLKRLGQPEEVAEVVAFLVSESAGYITGETIHVNGGMHM